MKPEKKVKLEKQADDNENFLENILKEVQIVKEMMYGFGDDINPLDETTQLIDKYSTDFLIQIAGKAYLRSKRRNKYSNEIKLGDVIYFIKDDLKQSSRAMKKVQAKLNLKRFREKNIEFKNFQK